MKDLKGSVTIYYEKCDKNHAFTPTEVERRAILDALEAQGEVVSLVTDDDGCYIPLRCRHDTEQAKGIVTGEMLDKLLELHHPYAIYDECGHDHEEAGGEVVDVEDVGLTCKILYNICAHCCREWDGDSQSEFCASTHTHSLNDPICKTIAILAPALEDEK